MADKLEETEKTKTKIPTKKQRERNWQETPAEWEELIKRMILSFRVQGFQDDNSRGAGKKRMMHR